MLNLRLPVKVQDHSKASRRSSSGPRIHPKDITARAGTTDSPPNVYPKMRRTPAGHVSWLTNRYEAQGSHKVRLTAGQRVAAGNLRAGWVGVQGDAGGTRPIFPSQCSFSIGRTKRGFNTSKMVPTCRLLWSDKPLLIPVWVSRPNWVFCFSSRHRHLLFSFLPPSASPHLH